MFEAFWLTRTRPIIFKTYYIFLDEIQKVKGIRNPYLDDGDEKVGFVDVLLGLMKRSECRKYAPT